MRKVAIIQARMSSSRLFGKVMLPLGDMNVLGQVIRRVKSAQVDDIVVATSEETLDNHIANFCNSKNINVYRGSLDNVLERYYHAAKTYKADIIVRVTSDCPLYDPSLLNKMLKGFNGYDYLSNTLTRTLPRGLDIEIFTFTALESAYRNAAKNSEREHVTPYIYHNQDVFSCKNYTHNTDLSYHRWTLDTKEDYLMINSIYEHLGNYATTTEIVDFLQRHQNIFAINNHIKQELT